MAIRVAKIYGKKPIVNVYEIADNFKDLDNLKIKNFGIETTEEWAKFVMNNRSRSFTDTKNTLCNKDNKYDIVDMISTDQNIEYDEAMNKFYNSEVFEKLIDKETGLYLESPEYVYDLFKDEMNFGHIIQAEI